MSNPTQQIKQMARNLFKSKSGSGHIQVKILHPKRDWFIGIGVACCIVIGIAVWNGYTYLSNRDGGATDTEIVIANPRYQAELVDQALTVFEIRATNFGTIAGSVAPTPAAPPEPTIAEVSTSTATSTPVVTEEESVEPGEEIVIEEPAAEVTPLEESAGDEVLVPELSQ